MKTTLYAIAGSLLLGACSIHQTGPLFADETGEDYIYDDAQSDNVYVKSVEAEPQYQPREGDISYIESAEIPEISLVSETSTDRVASVNRNIAIRDHDDKHVTYEYKDIRVDEVAAYAVSYCREQENKKAFLRDIILYRNHNRRATFDCVYLATEN